MRVECEVSGVDMVSEDGRPVDGVCVRCGRCDHEAEAYGSTGASVRRGLVMLRENCPEGERNFYTAEGDDD